MGAYYSSFISLESYLIGTALLNRIITITPLKVNLREIMSHVLKGDVRAEQNKEKD